MNILMLGVKEYPYGVSSRFEKHSGGGIAKVVIDLVQELTNNREVTSISLIVRRMPGQAKYEELGKLKIHRVGWYNSRYLRMPVFAFLSLRKAIILRNKIDIIHAHDGFAIFIMILFGRFFKYKGVVSSPHGGPVTKESVYHPLATKLYSFIESFNLKYASELVFLSEAEKDQLLDYYKIKPISFHVVPTGISRVNIIKQSHLNFNVVFIGRLMPRKGVVNLIEAINLLPATLSDVVKVTIVGDGHSRGSLEERVATLNLGDRVKFTGFSDNIGQYLAYADLLVLPSEGGEGLPISVLEAMSCGVAVMISNFDAPFKDSSYFKLKDNKPETISKIITDILEGKLDINLVAYNGLKEFEDFYSVRAAALRYLKLYKSLYKFE